MSHCEPGCPPQQPGPAGPRGPAGPQGPPGPQGPAGTEGAGVNLEGSPVTNIVVTGGGDASVSGSTGTISIFGGAPIQVHDTTFSPIGLWQFNDTLADTSGSGFDLVLNSGVLRYTTVWPGIRGVRLNGATRLRHDAQGTALMRTGDISIGFILIDVTAQNTPFNVVSYTEAAAGDANNTLYRISSGAQAVDQLEWEQQVAGGGIQRKQDGSGIWSRGQIHHVYGVREANVVQYYFDGVASGPASAVLGAAVGGTSSRLYVGVDTDIANGVNAALCSLKIVARALTAAEVRSEYNRTLGPFFGTI